MSAETIVETMLLRVEFGAAGSSLPEFSRALSIIDETWIASVGFAGYLEGETVGRYPTQPRELADGRIRITYQAFPRPSGIQLRKQSPLLIDFSIAPDLLPYGLTGTAVGLLTFFFRNPTRLGAFLPEIARSWHMTWSEAEKAKRARDLATMQAEILRSQKSAGGEAVEDTIAQLGDNVTRLEPRVLDSSGVDEFRE